MTSLLITAVVIAVALSITFVAGAAGLILAVLAGLILTCKIDPKGLAR